MMAEYYSVAEVARLLGLTPYAARVRIKRGTYPAFMFGGRVSGTPKRGFWLACVKQEQVGLIRPKDMPQIYRDEREKFVGDMSYEDYVLRGRYST